MHLALTGVPLPLRLSFDTPLSDDEFMRFCADNDDLRVEREETGEIYVMTPAGMNTGRKNSYIIQALTAWTDQDGRGYAFDSNTGWTLPDGSMRSPDAAWALASRCDALSEADQNRFAPLCPEFILELRSPSDRLPDLEAKMQKWILNGAELAWLIDPHGKDCYRLPARRDARIPPPSFFRSGYRPRPRLRTHHGPHLERPSTGDSRVTLNLALDGVALPMRLRFDTPMSDEELEAFSGRNSPLRMERTAHGEIVVMTPCHSITGKMNFRLARLLDEWTESDGRGVGFDSSTGFTLPDTSMLSPDASWIELSRWNALSDQQRHSFAPLCPDFIVEMRSNTDRLADLRKKMEQWIANGAQVAWLIDPLDRMVTIYRSNEAPEVHTDPSSVQGTGPIRGFELVLSRIWS